MGKNINGGNKNKKFARKQMTTTNTGKLRLSCDEYEKYAVVIRISGGAICRVKINGVDDEVICHIRGKYRGRNKGSNFISPGAIVLVGLRPDMSSKDECDLLYLYDSAEVEQLLKFPDLKIAVLLSINEHKTVGSVNDGFIFSNDVVEDFIMDGGGDVSGSGGGGGGGDVGGGGDIIDFDEI
jgi:translation initiation factor IF-1